MRSHSGDDCKQRCYSLCNVPSGLLAALRHFDLYLKPIKAAILESAAAKEILDMQGDDEDFDDELENSFDVKVEGVSTGGTRGGKKLQAGEEEGHGKGGSNGIRAGGGSGDRGAGGDIGSGRKFKAANKAGRRRKRVTSFRVRAQFEV